VAVKINWTHKAKIELFETYQYLEENWTYQEIHNLSVKLEETINILKEYPYSFPSTTYKNIRKAVILKYNSLYYRVRDDEIEILSFFSNRQKPKQFF
jgi:plasmid stabilization system protein ParE